MAAVGMKFSNPGVRLTFNASAALALWPTMVKEGWTLEREP